MKTMTLGELFTEEQLRQSAKIMQETNMPHARLVAMLEPDLERFQDLEVIILYAAYVLEWQRDKILEVYG